MEIILSFFKTDMFIFINLGVIVLLFILYIVNTVKLSKLRSSYAEFMKKLGNGNNIDEMLKKYMENVKKVELKNEEIISYCKNLDNNIADCTQNIGLIRYNAFKDTGSDLSFTLAMLNNHNDGIVLNGIYSRDTSNIYAKPIKNGKSEYVLSEEEKQAIEKAIGNK